MRICYSLADINSVLAALPQDSAIAFVPTMGALHNGHISLVKNALQYADTVIVSIFVNPTQFNNRADLATYPRTEEEDCKWLQEAGASIVFIPEVKEIYPAEDKRVFDFDGLDRMGEGPRRPGHFNGVAQVVTRLFDIIKPDYALFGEKDFQQLTIIRHFSQKMGYPVRIIASPTIREEDGLAMSSRNMLLTPEQREAAPHIYRVLQRAQQIARELLADNEQKIINQKQLKNSTHTEPDRQVSCCNMTPIQLAEWVIKEIDSNPLLEAEYVEIVNSLTLQIVNDWDEAESIQLCTAVFAKPVRLIDNIKLK
jgi:pantoate--beta-alanine ligase